MSTLFIQHQAQLTYAGFLREPFTAKDKKKTLFKAEGALTIAETNDVYKRVFYLDSNNPDESGELVKRTKNEIDELLFIGQLYKECKKYYKKLYESKIDHEKCNMDNATDNVTKEHCQKNIESFQLISEISGICLFYFVAAYYEYWYRFGAAFKDKRYNCEKFYQDTDYRNSMVKDYSKMFMKQTVVCLEKTAKENGKTNIVNNWIRSQACQEKFFERLREDIDHDIEVEDEYTELMAKYKNVPV